MTRRPEAILAGDREDEGEGADLLDLGFARVEVPLVAAWRHARAGRRLDRARGAHAPAGGRRVSFGLRISAVLGALAAAALAWC